MLLVSTRKELVILTKFESINDLEKGSSYVFEKSALSLIDNITLTFDNEVETTLPKESIKRLRFLGSSDEDFTGKAYTKDQQGGFVRLEIDVAKWEIFGMEMAYGKNAKISIAPKEIILIFKNRQISRVDIAFKNGTHIISNFLTKHAFEELDEVEDDNRLIYAKQKVGKRKNTLHVQIQQ